MTDASDAAIPVGINHIVLNVRDIEESHRFWTEIVGLRQVGALRERSDTGERLPVMRFYSGVRDGKIAHHDVALVENRNLPVPPAPSDPLRAPQAINHIAIAMPDRQSWLKKLADLQARGVKFHRRTNHGMTRSVYISDPNGYGVELLYELPREMWEGDVNAALNYIERLPTEGDAALADDIENAPRFGASV